MKKTLSSADPLSLSVSEPSMHVNRMSGNLLFSHSDHDGSWDATIFQLYKQPTNNLKISIESLDTAAYMVGVGVEVGMEHDQDFTAKSRLHRTPQTGTSPAA